MKKLIVILLLTLAAGVVPAQPSYTSGNLIAFFQARSSTGLRNFATEVDTGWTRGWANHFVLSAHDSADFSYLDTNIKKQFVSALRITVDSKDAGMTIDYSGMIISDNGNASTHYIVHSDFTISWCCPVTAAASFWISHTRN